MTEPDEPQTPVPLPPESGASRGNPWEQRAALGVLNGLVEALKLFVASPKQAFSQTLKRGDYGSPLLFAIVVGWIGMVIGRLWDLLFGASILSVLPSDLRGRIPFEAFGAGGLVTSLIFAPVFIVIGLFLWSAMLHLSLVIVGGLERSEAGFEGSFRVVSYSWVAQLANLIPVIGDLAVIVWSLVLAVIGVREIHKTTEGKAVVAVLIPVALCCVCAGLAVLLIVSGLLAMFASQ
jgi:hypothetical protein